MNIDELIKKVEDKESDLEELRERWNRRAAGFQIGRASCRERV